MAKKTKKKADPIDNEDSEPEDGGEGASRKKGGKGKLIAIIGVALIVILGGAGGGLFYLGYLDSLMGIEHEGEPIAEEHGATGDEPIDLGAPVYFEIPEFVADLKTGECRSPVMKLSLMLQIDELDRPILEERQPKIVDRILKYLREQERQNLVGEAGAETLRTEITLIVDATIQPAKVQNVLFKSMVLQ